MDRVENKRGGDLHTLTGDKKKEYFLHLDSALENATKSDLPIKDETGKLRKLMGFIFETEHDLFSAVPIAAFSGLPALKNVLSFVVNKCGVGEEIHKINLNLLVGDDQKRIEYLSRYRPVSEKNLEEAVREGADFNAKLVCDKIKKDLLNFSGDYDDSLLKERIEEWKRIRAQVRYYTSIVESDVMIDTDAENFIKFEYDGKRISYSFFEINTKLVDRKDRYVEVMAEISGYDLGITNFVKYILNLYFDKKALPRYFVNGDVDKGPSMDLKHLLIGTGITMGLRGLTAQGMFKKLSFERSLEPKSATTIFFGPFMDIYTGTPLQPSNLDYNSRQKIVNHITHVDRNAYLLEMRKETVERDMSLSPTILQTGFLSTKQEISTKKTVTDFYYIPSDSLVDLVSEELDRLGLTSYQIYTYRGGYFARE